MAGAILGAIVADLARDCFDYFICSGGASFVDLFAKLLQGSCELMLRWVLIIGWCGLAPMRL